MLGLGISPPGCQPQPGPTHLQQAHTEAFMSKLTTTSDITTGHHCQRGKGASTSEMSDLLREHFRYTKVSQPKSHQHRLSSVSPFPKPDSQKGEKVTSLLGSQMEMVHRRIHCQHSTGIKKYITRRKAGNRCC